MGNLRGAPVGPDPASLPQRGGVGRLVVWSCKAKLGARAWAPGVQEPLWVLPSAGKRPPSANAFHGYLPES
jgi:hypothetical protein